MAKTPKDKQHCWHEIGAGWTRGDGNAGSNNVRCCYCGEERSMTWSTRTRKLPNHGPHQPGVKERVNDAETAPCPARKDS